MDNLLKKTQIVQFVIILIFYILTSINEDEINNKTLVKDNPYYNLLTNIVKYNNILNDNIIHIQNNIDIINNCDNELLMKNNEYFYIFYNKYNIYVYFYKEKNSNIHNIYFNGLSKFNIKIILKFIFNKFNFDYIQKILKKKGNLYNVELNTIKKINKLSNASLIDCFDYLYNIDNNSEKINLNINGFSFGGILSQGFVHILLEKYAKLNKFNIEIFNIESWFNGDKENFDNFSKKINIKNIYNKKSILYFYNILVQPYFKIDHFINDNNYDDDFDIENILDYNINLFPNGIINYFNDNHLLSKIYKDIE